MEAGYDYLLIRGRLQRRFFNFSGIFLFVFGAMLLATSGAYYGYATKARADLNSLNVTLSGSDSSAVEAGSQSLVIPSQATLDPVNTETALAPPKQTSGAASVGGTGQSDPSPGVGLIRSPVDEFDDLDAASGPSGALSAGVQQSPAQLPAALASSAGSSSSSWALPSSAIGSQQLFPGESLLAAFWSNPLSYESASLRERLLLQGFTTLDLEPASPVGSQSPATRLIVPSIDVDSRVSELAIIDLGGSRAYETPDNVVGHIPETANAGEAGSSWFFGHTESPTLGEGSVFFNLSKIPGKLQKGEDVFVVTDNGEHRFLYRITTSRVVHQRDMGLYNTGKGTIHLVSCVPRLVYDHRLIVSGELIGIK